MPTPLSLALLGRSPLTDVLALDFKNGSYRSTIYSSTISALPGYTYTRTGAKSELDINGSLAAFSANVPAILPNIGYWSRAGLTNLFLNSATGATQNVTVTAQAYTLSFFGTGTITLTGTSTAGPLVGTGATDRVSLTFTPTAGSLTLTVSGSCTNVVLIAGSQPGPVITTTGSTAATGADVLTLTSPITSDVDFVAYAAVMLQAGAAGITLRPMSFNDGTGTNHVTLSRTSANIPDLIGSAGGSAITSNKGGTNTTVTSGRLVMAMRRKAGLWTLGVKFPSGLVSVGTGSSAGGFPTITRMELGCQLSTGQTLCPVELIGIKRGSLSDAELTNLLLAA